MTTEQIIEVLLLLDIRVTDNGNPDIPIFNNQFTPEDLIDEMDIELSSETLVKEIINYVEEVNEDYQVLHSYHKHTKLKNIK